MTNAPHIPMSPTELPQQRIHEVLEFAERPEPFDCIVGLAPTTFTVVESTGCYGCVVTMTIMDAGTGKQSVAFRRKMFRNVKLPRFC